LKVALNTLTLTLYCITGTAFAYQDDSSSDSDDEIQRQYRTAIKTANSIKRSDTFHSIKSGRSASRVAKNKGL
jgi:hypothetical protein